jgi:HTH-type transcriptional regulator/antitoxin HigA
MAETPPDRLRRVNSSHMDLLLMKATTLKPTALPATYAELIALQVPRPIHDRTAYDNAVEIVHALAGFKLNRDQDDYLQLMAKLVEDYERETMPEPAPVAGIETLKFLLTENGLNANDLGRILGVNRSIAYRILQGARNLTAAHIKKLSARFAVSADLLLA